MKYAILILAHKNIVQLSRLVERLNKDFDVYIHADQKWDIDISIFKNYKNVFFVKRHSVNWGSYIQIKATIELFKAASNKGYTFYMLISGHDLPLKSNHSIIEFIKSNINTSFVNSEIFPKKEWKDHNGGYERIEYYFGVDFKSNFIGKVKRKFISMIYRFQKKFNRKRKLFPIQYYGGWNWVNLNAEAMNYVIAFLKNNPGYIKTFKYTYCADEIWLQTILLNSPLTIINDNKRYTDWEIGAYHPKLLQMKDWTKIQNSDDLFARKFDENVDNEIIDKIYSSTL